MGAMLLMIVDITRSFGGETLCDFHSMAPLMKITNSSSCSDFNQQYLVPFDPNTSYWDTLPMKELQVRLNNKIERKEVLRVGVLGGSVSLFWINGSAPLASTLQRFLNYPNIEVYNGAMGGTGAMIPAGCLGIILGDTVLDVVILEFVINEFDEQNLRALVEHLQHRFNNDITIILLSVTSRLMKISKERAALLARGLSMNRSVAKLYGLILIDWSSVADKGYGITYRPDEIWHDKDMQHPNQIGQDWIQYCVGASIQDIYSHRDPSITAAVLQPSVIALQQDTLCLSSFICDVFGVKVHRFKQNSQMGKCWKMAVMSYIGDCVKLTYSDNFNPECTHDSDHTISFKMQVSKVCQLYFTVVGSHIVDKPVSICTLEVYLNDKPAYIATGYNHFTVIQLPYALLPVPLAIGAYNVTVVGRGTSKSPICSIGSIMCV